jgi:hypothetical protein
VSAPPRLRDELPYLCTTRLGEFGPLHVLSDDTLGFAFEMPVPVVDTAPEAEEDVAQGIRAMLHALEPGVQWQWFARSEPWVGRELARQTTQGAAPRDPFETAFRQRWLDAQQDGFFPDDARINFHPRVRRICVAMKSPPLGTGVLPGPLALLSGALRGTRPSSAAQGAAAFVRCAQGVLAAAGSSGWEPDLLDADGIADWVAGEIFPGRRADGSRPHVGAGEVRDAVASLGSLEDMTPGGFRSRARGDDTHHRVVSMLWPPPALAPGLLNEIPLLRPRITVSLTACALAPGKSLAQLKARALVDARSTHRFNQTEMQARADALQEVEHRIFADGERIFEMRLQVHVMEGDPERAEDAGAQVCKALERHEIEACIERDIGATLLLRGCLPFCTYPRTEARLLRRRRLLTRDCADLHPAGGCWTGTPPLSGGAPSVLYASPSGEPLHLDPTRAEKNPHALIVGQSGAGKSFFVHDYLLHLWRSPRVRLFLLSIKPDYRKLALLLGRYVEITLDSDDSLNPFGGGPTLENQGRWLAALRLMLTDGNGAGAPGRDADIALQQAALSAARRNWDAARNAAVRETLLEDICLELERGGGAIGRSLAHALGPYRHGPYHRLFNRPRTIGAGERFVFFNFGAILRQPCAALASFCVFQLVDEVMADPDLRAAPKGLVADEAWALVRDPQAASILERSLKAYRSLGGFALPIVQDPRDLDTPAGRVMLVNTATKVLLPLDPAGQADLGRYLRLNERELAIVQQLRLVKRRYGEFFVSFDGMRSARGLLIPDPLRYAVSTTDPADEERIERMYRECGDMAGALERFAREFPYGLEP